MSPGDYEFLSRLLKERSGLSLGTNKTYLLESRLVPLAQSCNLNGIPELCDQLRKKDERLVQAVTEAMTTNETLFFRDRIPFDELRALLLPELLAAREVRHTLRIWSAASSTGQEAYSIAMLLQEAIPNIKQWRIEIVATDIAEKMLERGRRGEYSQLEVQRGLPVQMLVKYFEKTDTGFRVRDDIRRTVQWRKQNLMDSLSGLGRFDIVFCRNVLIYFEPVDKADILNRIHRQTAPDGHLILGAAETVLGLTDLFQRNRACKSAVYSPVAVAAMQ